MTTQDITLTSEWQLIALTSAKTIITNTYNGNTLYRFGVASTSEGHILKAGETLVVDTDVYMKAVVINSYVSPKVAVSR